MTPFAATCALAGHLWLGSVGNHRAQCCLTFGPVGNPLPIAPAALMFEGECRIRRFKKRRSVTGRDNNGPITFRTCRLSNTDCCDSSKMPCAISAGPICPLVLDCCTFTATGPKSTDLFVPTPTPTTMAGSYSCESGKAGTYSLRHEPPMGCPDRDPHCR